MPQADVAIAGAGIIGLSAALELASAGLRVEVFERGRAMREASSAAGGMLGVRDPENPPALRPLSELSLGLYPEFLAALERLSGLKVPFRTRQTLQGMRTPPAGARPADRETIGRLAPQMNPAGLNTQKEALTFFVLEEPSIDPRDLVRALPAAVRAAGVTLREETEVTSIHPEADAVQIETSDGRRRAAHFVNAAGCWAARLGHLPIEPRRGQMMLLQSEAPLRAVIRAPQVHLIPRGDGRVVIGSTIERVTEFKKEVCPLAVTALRDAAIALWPPAAEAEILDTWSGLRPFAPDALPILGELRPRVWAAAGHFRNGILLAPATARILRRLILQESIGIDLAPFRPARFAPAAAR